MTETAWSKAPDQLPCCSRPRWVRLCGRGGYLAAKRVAGEGSLSSELSGAGEAICTDGGGLSQGGLVLWSNSWGQRATPDGDEEKLASWVSGKMINKRPHVYVYFTFTILEQRRSSWCLATVPPIHLSITRLKVDNFCSSVQLFFIFGATFTSTLIYPRFSGLHISEKWKITSKWLTDAYVYRPNRPQSHPHAAFRPQLFARKTVNFPKIIIAHFTCEWFSCCSW